MSKIVIIGAGAMGSAFSFPCLDNNHDTNIVGTHLENEFIDELKNNDNFHPGIRTNIPKGINIHFKSITKFLKKGKLRFVANSFGRISLIVIIIKYEIII